MTNPSRCHLCNLLTRPSPPVDPTGEGIGAANTLDDLDSAPTGSLDEDSAFNKNQDIIELEMRDFDDVDGGQIRIGIK
jgi:hypothetical protein